MTTDLPVSNNWNLFSHSLKARSSKSVSQGQSRGVSSAAHARRALEENWSLFSSGFWWLQASLTCGCITLASASVFTWSSPLCMWSLSPSLFSFLFFFFWPHHVVCGIFPDQGSNLCPLQWKHKSPNHWIPREVPCFSLIRRALVMTFRAHQIIQDDFSISTLKHICKDPFSKSGHTEKLRG